MNRLLKAAALILGLGGWAAAATSVTMDGPMTDTNAAVGQATAKNFALNMDNQNIDVVAVQVVYSTGAYGASTSFNDGRASSFTITVASYTALSSATASGVVLVRSTANVTNGSFVVGPETFLNGSSFSIYSDTSSTVATATGTACNIATAISNYGVFTATCNFSGGVNVGSVTVTAPYGSSYNGLAISWSTTTLISSATFSGGQDRKTLSINGVTLTANSSFAVATSSAVTATNIAAAINANTSLNTIVVSTAQSPCSTFANCGVVYTTATSVGTTYTTATSSQAAATITPFTSSSPVTGIATGSMVGAVVSSFTINTSTIKIASHGLPTGLPVYMGASPTNALTYSQVGGANGTLTANTSYYVMAIDANNIQLSLTSTGAVAGIPMVWTSSAVPTATDTYTLNIATATGTPTFAFWQGNDGVNFQQLPTIATQSITISSLVAPSSATYYDIGNFDWKWLQLRVTPPASGALKIQANVHGEKR